uniref:CPXCG motif-containing cysteine-rich protein n=1 Tax=Tenacibaculum sp. Pbs-1 TaxID=3238748 RepID=A0AB33L1I3_9FLAO
MMYEHFFQCPYCWEEISMLLDASTSETYVEDCEVCCNPIQITFTFVNNDLIAFEAKNIEQ